jgi:hypothetical protein
MTQGLSLLALSFILATASLQAADFSEVSVRDKRVLKRWSISGSPRGIAIGADGTVYVGLSEPQAVAAIDPATGRVVREVVLDNPDIASTKELVSMRTAEGGKRLIIAHGSDESVSILSLPDLGVIREITLEGETIRDAIPDPKGRYLYILGRVVHVYDFDGEMKLMSFDGIEPMAIAASASGAMLAIIGSEDFPSGKATVVAVHETETMKEMAREPLQTDREIISASFANDDAALVVAATDWMAEKSLASRPVKASGPASMSRFKIDFGDLMNSQRVCLPNDSGPQILSRGGSSDVILFAEKRCSASARFDAAPKRITFRSLYGVDVYAMVFDPRTNSLFATDRKGFITQYRAPE